MIIDNRIISYKNFLHDEEIKLIDLAEKYFSLHVQKYTNLIVLDLVFKKLLLEKHKFSPSYNDDLGVLKLLKNYVQASLSIPLTDESMSFVAWLFNHADVQTIKYKGNSAQVIFESIPWFAEKVKKRVTKEFNGKFKKIQTIKA